MAALLLFLPIALGDAAAAGLAFSAGFTHDAVLQREPAKAAIYGLAPAGTTGITLTVASDAADAAEGMAMVLESVPQSQIAASTSASSRSPNSFHSSNINSSLKSTVSYQEPIGFPISLLKNRGQSSGSPT